MGRLTDTSWCDLFLAADAASCLLKEVPDALAMRPAPTELREELSRLRAHVEATQPTDGGSDFRVDWEGVRLRVERMDTVTGTIFVCRRMGATVCRLDDLGFPPAIAAKLLGSGVRDGLVVFMGRTGSGKTTVAASYVAQWLSQRGGTCWTVENPVEMPLEGAHGEGWCYQTETHDDAGFGPSIKRILRASPNLILIGEIRDGGGAFEAMHAALSGHLVVATFHANDIVSGLSRLARMAGDSMYLADALRAAIHLRLVIRDHESARVGAAPPAGMQATHPPRVLMVEPLLLGNDTDGVRAAIRGGEYHMLRSEIERQRRVTMIGAGHAAYGGLPS